MRWLSVLVALAACNDPDRAWCDGNVAHWCGVGRDGEYCDQLDCTDRFCVVVSDPEPAAFCAAESSSRAACHDPLDDDGYFFACDGAELLKCSSGYALQITLCGDASLCVDGISPCLIHAGPDTTCAAQIAARGYSTGYCDGATRIDCTREYATAAEVCANGCENGYCR